VSRRAASEEATPAPRARLPRLALIAAVLLLLALLGHRGLRLVPGFIAWVDRMGPAGMLLFVLGYAVATVALIPGSVMTLAAGALFGVVRGTLVAFTGALLGSTLAFLVARYLARPLVERRVASDARFRRIDRAVGWHGRRLVFLLRLSPVLPFTLMNYALGITHVRLRDYLIASVGMLPGTLLYVWTGTLAGEAAAAAGGTPLRRGAAYWTVLAVGFLATVAVTVAVTRMARRALREAGRDEG
jgi:uncharacterized membrane protein YdjX (TVP38/TMEM64 family)